MPTPAVLGGIVVLGTAVVSLGGYFLYRGFDSVSLFTLEKNKSFIGEGEHASKFGGLFAPYFMSAEANHNSSAWNERFRLLRESRNLVNDSWFVSSKTAAEATVLVQTCKTRYTSEYTTNDLDKWNEVWIYCSIGGKKPLVLSESTIDEEKANLTGIWANKAGSDTNLTSKLLSIKSKENKWFWDIRNKQFSDGKLVPHETSHKYFHAKKTSNKLEKLSNICLEAYSKVKSTSSEVDKVTESELLTFCSTVKIS